MSEALSKSILDLRARILQVWPVEISDTDALSIGICGRLSNSADTIRLILNKNLSKVILNNFENVAFNEFEFKVALKGFATKSVNLPKNSLWFDDKIKKLESAFRCTLLESTAAESWTRQSVKIACVIAMHGKSSRIDSLDLIFGTSLVRSDVRRVEELNFEFVAEIPPPFELSVILDIIVSALV